MNRRSFILVGVVAPSVALAMPAEVIEAQIDQGRLDDHVARLRRRMTPGEQPKPAVQALLADVVIDVGFLPAGGARDGLGAAREVP